LFKKATKLRRPDAFEANPHGSEEDVRTSIHEYLDGQLTLDALDNRLTGWTFDSGHPPRIALEAELLIAEAARGHRPDLAGDLRALAAGADRESVLA
jgi:hypothetical protein